MPTAEPTTAKTAAIREHTARPTTMMIPAVTLLAKNSWLMPRKIAFSTPSMLFADAASAADRSVVLTSPRVTCASAGATRPPTRPLAKLSAPIRKINVMKLNAKVNGGTFQAPMNTAASAPCRTVDRLAPTTIQTITRTSQSGCRNSDSPAPTSTPLKPNSPARIAPRSIPITIAARFETTRPRTPAKPSHGSATIIATRIASPVTGLFMKQTCPTPRRQ